MIGIFLEIEKNQFYKKLESSQYARQVPFLISKSMNETAILTRKPLQRLMEKKLIIRKKGYPNQIRFNRSTKTKHEVTIYHKDENLLKQEQGGVEHGKIAVPDEVRSNIRRSIPKSKRPGSIKLKKEKGVFVIRDVRNKSTNKSTGRRRGTLKRTMRESLGGLKPFPGIYERTGRGSRSKVRRLYLFTRKARYNPVIDFTGEGIDFFKKRFPKIFRQNIQRYIGLDNL